MDVELLLHTRCFPQVQVNFEDIYDKRYLDAYGPPSKTRITPLTGLQERFKDRYRNASETLTAQLSVDPEYPSPSWNPQLSFNSVFSVNSFNEPCLHHNFENVFVPQITEENDVIRYRYTPKLANTLYLPESDQTQRNFSDLLKCQRSGGEPNVLTPEQYLAMMKLTIKNIKMKMQVTEMKLSMLNEEQKGRLRDYIHRPRRSRLNTGPISMELALVVANSPEATGQA